MTTATSTILELRLLFDRNSKIVNDMQYTSETSLYTPEFRKNAYAVYAQMRERSPVIQHTGMFGGPMWFVTGHAAAMDALRDHKRFRADYRFSAELTARFAPPENSPIAQLDNHLLNLDPPDHTRLRALVSKAFTTRRVNALRPRIQEIAEQLLADLPESGTMDLLSEYAFPLPITVIAELLGVPVEDRDKFRHWSNVVITPALTAEQQATSQTVIMEFFYYMTQLVEQRRHQPQDDLISSLLNVQEGDDVLTASELFSMIFLLLIAGHETTVNLIANAVLALFKHPDQKAELLENPALMPTAVEEFLRYDNPVERALTRFVAEDFEFYGQQLKRNDFVLIILGAANHDPALFERPAELDIHRQRNKHLGFGMGVHYCLGAPLARLEGEIALNTLLAHLPTLRPDRDLDDLEWRTSPTIRGLVEFPVAWG